MAMPVTDFLYQVNQGEETHRKSGQPPFLELVSWAAPSWLRPAFTILYLWKWIQCEYQPLWFSHRWNLAPFSCLCPQNVTTSVGQLTEDIITSTAILYAEVQDVRLPSKIKVLVAVFQMGTHYWNSEVANSLQMTINLVPRLQSHFALPKMPLPTSSLGGIGNHLKTVNKVKAMNSCKGNSLDSGIGLHAVTFKEVATGCLSVSIVLR